jgi:predicted TIM-barrel fold metal-dependent hydrolase
MIIDGHHHIEAGFSHILERMDALGIDRTVLIGVGVSDLNAVTVKDVLPVRWHLLLRTIGVMKMRQLVRSRALQDVLLGDPINSRVLEAITAEPQRFYGFVFVNPESENCFSEIERCLNQGMCGIKLALLQYPTNLAGPRMHRICEIARERKVPIFFHQGITKESSDPSLMFRNFPEVTFIIAHAGVQYYHAAIELANSHKNVYIDTSSWIVTKRKLKNLYRQLGPEKLIFGTDVPVMANDQSDGLKKIRVLRLPPAEEACILGENLLRILPTN